MNLILVVHDPRMSYQYVLCKFPQNETPQYYILCLNTFSCFLIKSLEFLQIKKHYMLTFSNKICS